MPLAKTKRSITGAIVKGQGKLKIQLLAYWFWNVIRKNQSLEITSGGKWYNQQMENHILVKIN